MSFKEDLLMLKRINKETIVIVQNGIFYIAIGNDAILLNKVLGLKCTCFARGICKVGFPIKSLRKYTTKLKEANYKYVVYDNKLESYIKYMLDVLIKLPRTEKFSIGTEYKMSMYEMLEKIMYFNKDKSAGIVTLNKIDTELNVQRIYLRIMHDNKWIDSKKFKISMDKIYEIGKILGGLIKYYAKENKKHMG